MRHFLVARPVATCPRSIGRAVPGGWFGSAVRQHANCDGGPVPHNRRGNRFCPRSQQLQESAPLAPTSRAHIEPGRHHAGIVASADITWTSATIARDTRPAHTCPGTVWGTALSSVTRQVQIGTPCLPLVQGKPLPAFRSSASTPRGFLATSRVRTTLPVEAGGGARFPALHLIARFERV